MKLLVLSHNAFSSFNNMGKTLRALCSEISRDELCQFYCYPTLPDVDICHSAFRLTDKDILRSLVPPFTCGGREIRKDEIKADNGLFEDTSDRSQYHVKSHFKRLLRDLMWAVSPWYGKPFRSWLKREKPTCILVAPGDAAFLYDIAVKLSKKLEIPLAVYICDDNYFRRPPTGFWARIRFARLRKKHRALFKHASHGFYISEEALKDYTRHFGVEGSLMMTGADMSVRQAGPTPCASRVTYMGNLRWGRNLVLREIGETLDAINRDTGSAYELHIYTDEQDPTVLAPISDIPLVKRFGFLKGEAYGKTLTEAELLLHVEGFDEESRSLVRYSVSTKLADALSSGVPIFAYGPEDSASMMHLIRHESAVTAINREELRDKLTVALSHPEARAHAVDNAGRIAEMYHQAKRNSALLKDILQKL